jgi:signal peptidase I
MSELEFSESRFANVARQVLSEGHVLKFCAQGSSMWPFIRPGDLLSIQPENSKLSIGDVVLAVQTDHRWLVHRITQICQVEGSLAIVTRGDALAHTDPPVPVSQVLGRLESLERKGRTLDCSSPAVRMLVWIWRLSYPVSYRLARKISELRK